MNSALYVAADKGIMMEELKEEIFEHLKLIRVYLKPQGKKKPIWKTL